MKRARIHGGSDDGQILVLFAGGIMALLVFLGMVIDGGNAWLNRRSAQNAADIASLDATSLIATAAKSGTTATKLAVWTQIGKSVAANDCSSTGTVPCTWQAWYQSAGASGPVDLAAVANATGSIPTGTIGVRVVVRRQPGTFLARLASIGSWDVNATASSIASSPSTAATGTLLPVAVKQSISCGTSANASCFTPGQVYDLTDGMDAPGGFGYLSWTGSNDPNALATSICTPNNPAFTLPTQFPVDPGKSNSSSVRACLDGWIASGQTVLVPIYSTVTGTGNNAKYTVVSIAAFVLTSRDQPAVDNIRGYFVGMYDVAGGTVPGSVGTVAPKPGDTTVFVGLVR